MEDTSPKVLQFCPTVWPLSAINTLKPDTTKTTLIFGLPCHLPGAWGHVVIKALRY